MNRPARPDALQDARTPAGDAPTPFNVHANESRPRIIRPATRAELARVLQDERARFFVDTDGRRVFIPLFRNHEIEDIRRFLDAPHALQA
jgi:hypothetical protein